MSVDAVGLSVLEEGYVVVGLPREVNLAGLLSGSRGAEALLSVTWDPVEVTLVVEEACWSSLAAQYPEARIATGWRAIRFEATFDFSVVGFLAGVSRVLAEAGIPLLCLSTFSTDLLLVREEQLPQAVDLLRQFLTTTAPPH